MFLLIIFKFKMNFMKHFSIYFEYLNYLKSIYYIINEYVNMKKVKFLITYTEMRFFVRILELFPIYEPGPTSSFVWRLYAPNVLSCFDVNAIL